MLGIPSRIVSVSSGEELSTKGGELSHHFKTQGIPVMIGKLGHNILSFFNCVCVKNSVTAVA